MINFWPKIPGKNLSRILANFHEDVIKDLKVAEHSFQVPMLNAPSLHNYLCFGAHFLQEPSLTMEVFILAFWLGYVLLPWQQDWLKTKLRK